MRLGKAERAGAEKGARSGVTEVAEQGQRETPNCVQKEVLGLEVGMKNPA